MQIALEERISQHSAYINTEKLLNIMQETDTSKVSAKGFLMLERINTTFQFLKDSLDRADPWLVSLNTLNTINNSVINVLSEMTNFNNDKNEQRLQNISSQLENIILYFSQVAVVKSSEEIESLRQSIVRFRQSVGQHLGNFERDMTESTAALVANTEKLNDLSTSINSQKARVDNIINDFQSQFANAQTKRGEEVSDFLKQGEKDFNNAIASSEESFSQLILTQEHSFQEITEENNNQLTAQQEAYNTLIEDLQVNVATELEQMKEMNKEAENLLGLMSMKGLAQGYQKIANSEAKKALSWNVLSVGSLLGILWFGFEFIVQHEGEMSWPTLVSRMVLTGVGITLFTYAAKQANSHRAEERHNRKIELELASLDPYLKDLEKEKQKEVKQSLVGKYFGVETSLLPSIQQGQVNSQQNQADSILNNPQVLQLIVERVTQHISGK